MKSFIKRGATLFCALGTLFSLSAQDAEKWVTVNLETPGTLGVEILYQADKLSDVTHLKISGPINSSDWDNIKNLSNIEVIDMEKAVTTAVPAYTFQNRGSLTSITLPSGIETIGEYAFYATSLESISFPQTLSSISQQAFRSSKIKTVTFPDNSNLESLGNYTFANCESLKTVKLPKTSNLIIIPEYCFYQSKNLTTINIPDGIAWIRDHAFSTTSSLTVVSLPESLECVDWYAFEYSGIKSLILPPYLKIDGGICNSSFRSCRNLEEVVFPSVIHSLPADCFYDCRSLKKITCKSLVAPSLGSNVFYNVPISEAVLTVPEVSVPAYKLDSNWLSFGTIQGGATSDYWSILGSVDLNNNRRLDGTPSITIEPNGALTVGGTAAFPINDFLMNYDYSSYNLSQWSRPSLVNSSAAMTAKSIATSFLVSSNKWYFLSLPYDVKVSDITHSEENASFVVRYYDGAIRASQDKTGNSWQNYGSDDVIPRGTAFIYSTDQNGTITFKGGDNGKGNIFDPNSFTAALEANKANSSANSGWNFIGNPFPSYYDMYYAMLDCPVTIYNHYNNRYDAFSLIDDDVVLLPGEGFFIQANDELKEIVFSNLGKQNSNDVARDEEIATRASFSERSLFDFVIRFNNLEDKTRVVLNDEAKEEYELGRDAAKFMSDNASLAQIYTISGEADYLAINELPASPQRIKLGVFAPSAGEMAISINRCDGSAWLYDLYTGTSTLLKPGEAYNFNIDQEGTINDRFELALVGLNTAGIESSKEENVRIYVAGNKVNVQGVQGARIIISSIDGKVVENSILDSDKSEFILPAGLYIIRAGNQSAKCLIK